MLKKIIITVLVILLIGGFVFFVRSRKVEVPYTESQVINTDIKKTINVDATMNPDVYADIASELPTLIESIEVDVNDEVEKGQELLTLDKKSIAAQIANAKLAVERAELAEQQARRKWDTLKPEERESIKKATQQARESLNEVYAQATKTTITSPIDGIVIEQNGRVGEVAQGTIMRIIDPKSLQVEALVPEVDVSKVQKGDNSYIVFDAYPDKVVKGTFVSMDYGSTLDQNNTYFKAIIDIDDKTDITILDGMNAEVDIEIDSRSGVTAVPREYAKKDDQGYFVYKLKPEAGREQFKKVYFEEGLLGDDYVEVVSGLSVGEKIALLQEEK
jgi:RND family efflux transporter MFP subunit